MNAPKFRIASSPSKAAATSGTDAPPDQVAQFVAGAAMVASQAASPSTPAPETPASAPAYSQMTTPTRPPKPCRLNVELEPHIHTRLRHLAVARGTSVSALIRIAIERELASTAHQLR